MAQAASPHPGPSPTIRENPSDAGRLLTDPPLRAVLRLALPTSAVMVLGATSSVLHTYFVSRLGAEAIASVSLVFPIALISMTMMSGGIGAGVSAAISHGLGAGRRREADSVAEHAFLITGAASVLFTSVLLLGSPLLFRLMGGQGQVLTGATLFARVLFGGSIITFAISTFDSILRAEGNVRVPSIWATVSLTMQMILTPVLMFLAGMGLAGAAAATIAGQLVGAIPRARHIFSARGVVRPRLWPARVSIRPIQNILRVGVPASLATLANYLGLMLLTAVVARYGAHDLAAFGLGTRLDFLVITLAFGVGSAVLTLVGLARGAGDLGRVRAVVTRALALVGAMLSMVALLLVVWPGLWLRLFTDDPEILEIGSKYLRALAPSYPFLGTSMIFAFAFQGLGRAVLPLLLMVARTIIVVAIAVGLSSVRSPVASIFLLMAAGNMAMSMLLFWQLRRLWREGG